MLKQLVRKIMKTKDKIVMSLIAKVKLNKVLHALDYKRPMQVINANGYTFHVKDVDAIIHTDTNNNMAVSEVASVYKTSLQDMYVIAVDKTYMKLSKRTQAFVLHHEIAHITHGLDNPTNRVAIETKVDIVAGSLMQLNKRAMRNCLREIRRQCKYYSSYEILTKRIKNIK